MAFDKTGTLTQGRYKVTGRVRLGGEVVVVVVRVVEAAVVMALIVFPSSLLLPPPYSSLLIPPQAPYPATMRGQSSVSPPP